MDGRLMGVDESKRELWRQLQADAESTRSPQAAQAEDDALKGGGGGGTSGGGMEARLAKLEAQMEHVQADLIKLAHVPADVAAIKAAMVTHKDLSSQLKTLFMAMCAAGSAIAAVTTAVLKLT